MPEQQETTEAHEQAIAAFEDWVRQTATSGVLTQIAKRQILRESELTAYSDDPPAEWVDNPAIKEAVWQLAAENIISTQDDLDNLALNRYQIGSRLLSGPEYESDEWFEQDAIWRAGWIKAEQVIWQLIDHKFGSTFQRWTRERLNKDVDGPRHVFVKKSDGSVYITTNEKFVAHALYTPEEDKLVFLAAAIGTQRALFETQMPALKGQGTSLKTLGQRVSKKARAAYDAKAALNNGHGIDADDEE